MSSLPGVIAPTAEPPRVTRFGRRITLESSQEYVLIEEVRAGVVAFHFEGWTTNAHISHVFETLESSLARCSSVVMITNGDGCSGCDTEVREFWTKWTTKWREKIVAQHYYAPSPMMRMGLQMMSMESGAPIRLYKEQVAFESAVLAAYPTFDVATIRARSK